MEDIMNAVSHKATEDFENFIFTTIRPYCEEVAEMKISKELLIRALIEYKENHSGIRKTMREDENG